MKNRGSAVCVVVIAALAVAVTAGPAMAAGKPAPRIPHVANEPLARSALTESQQDRQIARTKRRLAATIRRLTALSGDVSSLKSLVPVVTSALTQLSTGLTTVGTGLQKAATSLQTLGTFVTADEYGIVQIATGSGFGTPVAGCFYESPNIPDNVQDAIVSGTCIIPASVAAGSELHFQVGIRSNEDDGTGPNDLAGVAGLVSYDQTANKVEVVAPPASSLVQVLNGAGATGPNAGLGGAPANAIPLKSPMVSTTETSFPFATISTDNLYDLTESNFIGTPSTPVVGVSGGGAAGVRFVHFTIRFNDLTPNPNDPAA